MHVEIDPACLRAVHTITVLMEDLIRYVDERGYGVTAVDMAPMEGKVHLTITMTPRRWPPPVDH